MKSSNTTDDIWLPPWTLTLLENSKYYFLASKSQKAPSEDVVAFFKKIGSEQVEDIKQAVSRYYLDLLKVKPVTCTNVYIFYIIYTCRILFCSIRESSPQIAHITTF